MNPSERDTCRRCGAVIPATSTERLCPACLMSGALEPAGGGAQTVSLASGESLSLYGPSEFPCEFGGYRLLGLLGRGGMGTVYEAEQLATGRRVTLTQLLGLAFHSTIGHSIFRLAVVDTKGGPANRVTLLRRWAIVWLPLFVPMSFAALSAARVGPGVASGCALVVLVVWIGAAVYAVIHPNRGLHDRLAGTWVVRR